MLASVRHTEAGRKWTERFLTQENQRTSQDFNVHALKYKKEKKHVSSNDTTIHRLVMLSFHHSCCCMSNYKIINNHTKTVILTATLYKIYLLTGLSESSSKPFSHLMHSCRPNKRLGVIIKRVKAKSPHKLYLPRLHCNAFQKLTS